MSLTIALNLSRFSPKPFKPVSRVKLFFWFSHWSRLSHLKSNLNQVLIVGDIHNYSFLFLLCFNYCRNKTKLLILLQNIQYSEIDSGCMWHLSDEGLLGSSSICWTSLFLENNLWRMWRLKTANDFCCNYMFLFDWIIVSFYWVLNDNIFGYRERATIMI